MSYFAQVINGIVEQVIVAEQDHINTLPDASNWIQTFSEKSGFAAIGYTYDSTNNVFYGKAPFESWVLNKETWLWEAPISYPTDGKEYSWNEATISWKEAP